MDQALIQVGLPVKCRWGECDATDFIKPRFVDPIHKGWYKSKMYRYKNKHWYCPEHYEKGREVDNHFYENYKTPDPYPDGGTEDPEETVDELYKLLD